MGELMAKHMWRERHQEIVDDTKKFVAQIIARYRAAYSYCILQQLRKDLGGRNESSLLLEQRKWQSYNRPLQSGAAYVLCGSDNRKWRRRYCVLQPDYTLEVYDSEEDYEVVNRPRYARKHSSFNVVDNVDNHLSQMMKDYLRDFGYARENVTHVVKKVCAAVDPAKRPTQHILGLYHNYRGCFYMATDSAVEKDKWLKSMRDAQRQLAGVHCENLAQRKAFEFAIRQTCDAEEHCNITVKVAGTQEEITEDFIAAYLADGCKRMMQTRVKGDVCKKYRMWLALMRTLFDSIECVVKEDYPALRAKAEAEAENYRQRMLTSMPQINATFETLSAEIVAGLEGSFHDELEMKILPKIPDTVAKMGDSMATPLREVKDIFLIHAEAVQQRVTSKSTEFANNIDQYFLNHLDIAPRNADGMHNVFLGVTGTKSPFGILSETFPKAVCLEHEAKLCILMQKLLDSAMYTFQFLCGEVVAKSDGHLQAVTIARIERRVLKKLSHDNVILTKQFLNETMVELVFQMLRSAIYHNSKNKMRDYEDFIPSEFKAFLPVPNIFHDAVLDKLAQDLRPLLLAAFKRLAHDHFNMVHSQSSSTINSYSSDDMRTFARNESSTSKASSSHSSPAQVPAPVKAAAVLDQEDQTPLHENDGHDVEIENVSDLSEGDASEDEEGCGGTPCPENYVKDGETGECVEKVDENGEPISQDGDSEAENIPMDGDGYAAQVSAAESLSGDSSEDCDVPKEPGEGGKLGLELEQNPGAQEVGGNRELQDTASEAESLDEDQEAYSFDAGEVVTESVKLLDGGATMENRTAVEINQPVYMDNSIESSPAIVSSLDENGEFTGIVEQDSASEFPPAEQEEIPNLYPNDSAGENTESQLSDEVQTNDKEFKIPLEEAAESMGAQSATSDGEKDGYWESENDEDGSSCGEDVQEQSEKKNSKIADDDEVAKNAHPVVVTSFSSQQDSQDVEKGRQPNGSVTLSGPFVPAGDAEDNSTPPVPARKKKRTPPKIADPQILILSEDNDVSGLQSQRYVDNAGPEKYNGVPEQIIQTGEEKLI